GNPQPLEVIVGKKLQLVLLTALTNL
ncbi:MAG: hypothetical protein ACI8W9_000775, partial [Psychromonas sp.]